MVQFTVYAFTSASSFSQQFDNLHDAEVSVSALKEVNAILRQEGKHASCFHGWVTEWHGYSLEDGSRVTESAQSVIEFD